MAPDLIAQAYDAVFDAAARSETLDGIWRATVLDQAYPDGFEHLSFVTLPELRALAAGIGLQHGQQLADLGCGAGGPGLWLARETGASIVGVDVSRVAIRLAAERADRLGIAPAQYREGSFGATGLDDGSVDAVVSVDAMQYAPDKHAALAEMARIVRPGGRVVFTTFEVRPEAVAGLPGLGDDPIEDFRPLLEDAGLAVASYEETPGWEDRVAGFSRAVVAAEPDLRREVGEMVTAILLFDATSALERKPYRRRIMAIAERR